jgi:hypothetical protein
MTRVRWALGTVGVLLVLCGVRAFVVAVPPRQWPGVVTWLGAGVVVHDAVLAPCAVALGWLVLRRAPEVVRPPLRLGLLAVVTVAVIGIPLLAAP